MIQGGPWWRGVGSGEELTKTNANHHRRSHIESTFIMATSGFKETSFQHLKFTGNDKCGS